jgi:hypothetical protein
LGLKVRLFEEGGTYDIEYFPNLFVAPELAEHQPIAR